MEIKLTKEATIMLYRMFWQPQTLTEDKAYSAKDDIAKSEVISVMRWLSTKVFKTANKGMPEEKFEFIPFTGKVKQRYIDRMLDVIKNYDKSGRLVHNCISYQELLTGLTGKDESGESVDEE